ncbi:MAG: DUF402 domain-containing protein [Anaerolineales bacterium]
MKILKKNIAGETTWRYEGAQLQRGENFTTIEAHFNREDMAFQGITLKRGDLFVETFYADRWYNIFEIYDRDDRALKGWYCNIAKPAVITADEISYVDLALDLWISANGEQTVLDEDELQALNLGKETLKKIYAALAELQARFTRARG